MINQFVKPLVSIVIPCYNCENTIEEAIGSALSQTYTNIEVIVVNDGSVDNSESIVAELIKGDSRLSIYSQTNKGVSAVRNLGLRVARGSFIVFLDGDDKLKDSYIDLGVNIFEKKPDLTLVYSNMELFERESGLFPLPKFNLKNFLKANCIPVFALVRTDQLRAIGGFDESIAFCEDWECWIHLFKQFNAEVYRIEEPQYYYRKRFTIDSALDKYRDNHRILREVQLYIFQKHQQIYVENEMSLDYLFILEDELGKFRRKYYHKWYKRIFYLLFKPKKYSKLYQQ